MELVAAPTERPVRRRTRRDPKARFLADISSQMDAVAGCPELLVPQDHVARRVAEIVQLLGAEALEAGYSSLGRHGHDPKRLLAVWIYASVIGIHHASKLAAACKTDAALRLLAGGHSPSAATLKRFRHQHGDFFRSALERTVALAHERGLLKTEELAVDSMRLRANASRSAIRHEETSRKRVGQLEKADTSALSDDEKQAHEEKLERHRETVETCTQRGVASFVETNELASMMRFPFGAAFAGHRITATAAGASERIVVGVLVDADPTDHGKLRSAVDQAVAVLGRVGVPTDQKPRVLADAGYWDADSLQYADTVREKTDVVIADPRPKPTKDRLSMIPREKFILSKDLLTVTCPAGRPMKGRESAGRGKTRWVGDGCEACELRPKCTKAKGPRVFTVDVRIEAPRQAMRIRLKEAREQRLYRLRSAIIEPVFASLEHEMDFRRASSRNKTTVIAEVLLKLLAHNVRRLVALSRLSVVWFECSHDGRWTLWRSQYEF